MAALGDSRRRIRGNGALFPWADLSWEDNAPAGAAGTDYSISSWKIFTRPADRGQITFARSFSNSTRNLSSQSARPRSPDEKQRDRPAAAHRSFSSLNPLQGLAKNRKWRKRETRGRARHRKGMKRYGNEIKNFHSFRGRDGAADIIVERFDDNWNRSLCIFIRQSLSALSITIVVEKDEITVGLIISRRAKRTSDYVSYSIIRQMKTHRIDRLAPLKV